MPLDLYQILRPQDFPIPAPQGGADDAADVAVAPSPEPERTSTLQICLTVPASVSFIEVARALSALAITTGGRWSYDPTVTPTVPGQFRVEIADRPTRKGGTCRD